MEIKELVNQILELIIEEINTPSTKEKISNEIVSPFITYITKQLYPYLITTCIIFVLMFLCIISVLILILSK
jgi:hypothetical protein